MSVEVLLSRLDKVKGTGPRWRALCPAHESKNQSRSLSIFEPEPGRTLLHCHAGCSVHDVTAALGIDLADLFPKQFADDQRQRRERKPWRTSDIVGALRAELLVAWVAVNDVADGKTIDSADRVRAGVARQRIAHLLQELERAN